MRRRLFNFAAAVSLVLFVAVVVLWVRSYRTQDYAIKGLAGPETLFIDTQRGWISLCGVGNLINARGSWEANSIPWNAVTAFRPTLVGRRQPAVALSLPGVRVGRVQGWMNLPGNYYSPFKPIQSIWCVSVRFAWLAGLSGFVPSMWLGLRIRSLRRCRPGCCTKCRYDLTGNTSGVCPECGTAISK